MIMVIIIRGKHMKNIIWSMKETIICGILLVLGIVYNSPLILIASIIIGGFNQTKEGLMDTIENKHLNVELLMILSAIGACLIGYYSEGAILIFIFSLSGALEDFTLDQSQREIRNMMALQPNLATRLLEDGSTEVVPVEALKVGESIIVAVGEIFPIDATITSGRSSIEEAAITGEALPIEKSVGESVFGGTLNISSPLVLSVATDVSNTLIQKIIKMVEDAQQYPSKTARFIDKLEDMYARVILISVFLVIVIPYFFMDVPFVDAFYKGMILLVVASPCALIASVTPATLAAISNGARRGILVKGGIHFENLFDVKAIAFDKTGTLTHGLPSLTDQFFIDENEEHLDAIAALENYSSHPLASAIVTGLARKSDLKPTGVKEKAGFGVEGDFNGNYYLIGNRDYVGNVDDSISKKAQAWASVGKSLVFVSCNDKVIGALGLADEIRDDSRALVKWLNDNNYESIMITGDNEVSASHIAKEIGITRFIASCLPDQKSEIIKDLEKEYGSVVMMGDGINDAPALANATVGIAMGSGSDIAIESADIILVKDDVANLAYALDLSKRLRKIIVQNITFSFAVILLLVISNFMSKVSLPLGVIGHEGSTILVILNSLRLLKSKKVLT